MKNPSSNPKTCVPVRTWFFEVERSPIEIILIRSGMVWGYWRVVGRDIGGSGEKWWDYCIFCFSQQTAVAQAVTGVFSTPGCSRPPASKPTFTDFRLGTVCFTLSALCVFEKRGAKMFNFELLFLHGFSSKNCEILNKAVLTPQE